MQKKVTRPNGTETMVVADSKEDLDAAVANIKKEPVASSPDINVPVAKGHDLLDLSDGGVTVGLTDGRGAHNSPNDAVRENGSLAGDPKVPVVVGQDESGEDVVLEQEKADKKSSK